MTIEWLSTKINPPEAGREIVAKNPLKPNSFSSASKQCRVMKFLPSFTEDMVISIMLGDNLTLWAYTS